MLYEFNTRGLGIVLFTKILIKIHKSTLIQLWNMLCVTKYYLKNQIIKYQQFHKLKCIAHMHMKYLEEYTQIEFNI